MSETIHQVKYDEFVWILTTTQKLHIDKGEPIPEIHQSQIETVKYCLEAPFAGIEEAEFYPSFDQKAAVLFYMFIKRHPLINGNKRMAVQALAFFIFKNGRYPVLSEDKLIELAKLIVETKPEEKAKWIEFLANEFNTGIRKQNFKFYIKLFMFITEGIADRVFRRITRTLMK